MSTLRRETFPTRTARSSGPGAIVCKSRATGSDTCHVVRRDSSAIKFDSIRFGSNPWMCVQEWAIHTGRYREGTDNPDWPSWKTRLRCALNKLPDIQELKDQSCYDEPNPFRVYKFVTVDRRGEELVSY